MADLTIRDLDEGIIEALKRRAKASARSLEAEMREILIQAARPAAPVGLRAQAERVAAMTPDVPQTDSAGLLREDRDR